MITFLFLFLFAPFYGLGWFIGLGFRVFLNGWKDAQREESQT